jgi:hypothetical protein
LREVFVIDTLPIISLLKSKKIEIEDVAIKAARSEAHIIFEPINAPDFVYMALALIVRWAFICIEVINIDCSEPYCAGEEVTSVAELNLPASLDLQLSCVASKLRPHHIVNHDFVALGAHYMETARMQCNCKAIILNDTRDNI